MPHPFLGNVFHHQHSSQGSPLNVEQAHPNLHYHSVGDGGLEAKSLFARPSFSALFSPFSQVCWCWCMLSGRFGSDEETRYMEGLLTAKEVLWQAFFLYPLLPSVWPGLVVVIYKVDNLYRSTYMVDGLVGFDDCKRGFTARPSFSSFNSLCSFL